MSTLTNVIVVGASGNLGPSILSALQSNPSLTISLLARSGSSKPPQAPHGVRVLTADFTSHISLVTAFTGQDAVVSAVGGTGVTGQIQLIDAAIEAGVKRFIPSEYSTDTMNEKTAALAVNKQKVEVNKYLWKKAEEGRITWTAVATGAFFDWGLTTGFIGFNIAEKKATLFDGGHYRFSATTVSDIGRAVLGIFTHPAETKNRYLYIHSTIISQREILAIYEKLTGAKWEVTVVDTAELEREANEKIAVGDFSKIVNLLFRTVSQDGYGGRFEGASNELFGIGILGEEGVEAVVRATL